MKTKIIVLVMLFVLTLVFSEGAFAATESIAIVRPDCENKSISTANCYTSLASWETTEQRNLVTADQIAVAQIEGNWNVADTSLMFISGWTTDETRYIKIHTTDEARHSGIWSEDKYRLESSGTVLYVAEENVRIEGLQINQTDDANNSRHGIRFAPEAQSHYYVSNSIIKGNSASTGSFSHGIVTTTSGYTGSAIYLWNNIIYNFISNNTGVGISLASNHTAYIYNNTINNCFGGIYHISNADAKNNLVQNTAGNAFGGFMDFADSSDYNISDDATSTGGLNDKTNQSVTFISQVADAENLHLNPNDTIAKDAGLDLSEDSNLSFLDDIDGTTREGTWDIGADELSFVLRSDVDNNSLSNTTDALLTLRNSIGLNMQTTSWQASLTTGDVNCDGNSNSTDALLILRYSLGLTMNGTLWCE